MKKSIFILALFALLGLLSGCKNGFLPPKNEIDQLSLVQVVGVDKDSKNPQKNEVTIIINEAKSTGKSDSGGGGSPSYTIVSSSGVTDSDAVNDIKTHSAKTVFFGYTDFFLIGEDAARDDISKFYDSYAREPAIRLSPKIYIIKGSSAKDFINQTSTKDTYIADKLGNIEADINTNSNIKEVSIIDLAGMLNNKTAAAILPVLRADKIEDKKGVGSELPEKEIETSGYAIIKDFRLVDYIGSNISRGYNFLTGNVKSGMISVPDQTGKYVALEIIKETIKVEPEFDGDIPVSVVYKTHFVSNVDEQHSRENIYTQASINDLCKKQSEIIKAEMESVIAISKKNQIDCTNLGESIRMQHPIKWERIKDKWREIYPTLKIEVQVESDIGRTYNIQEPVGYDMEK